jgi:hypothetical protein
MEEPLNNHKNYSRVQKSKKFNVRNEKVYRRIVE